MSYNKKNAKNTKNKTGKNNNINNKNNKKRIELPKIDNMHIDVLDGIRAMAILIVVWFHIWQQCWLIPNVRTPFLEPLGISSLDFDWIPRTGYMMVVMMIFLSGFCLYLPHARSMAEGTPVSSTGTFYKKRIARIIPSYLFSVIVVLIYDIYNCSYTDPSFVLQDDTSFMLKDILSHLTFTYNLIPSTASNTLLNGVLWTVALEVQFYIIFPLVACCFKKQPILSYIVMNAISCIYTIFAVDAVNVPFMLHQLPSYMGVYANGFLGAVIFVQIAKNYNKIKNTKVFAAISTIISFACIFIYNLMMNNLRSAGDINVWQLKNRLYVSVLFLVFVISTAYSAKWFKFIFSNKAAKFISTISFNLYIWHQFLCVSFKNNRIPYYEGDIFPNEIGDKPWMWKLFLLSFASSFAAAIAVTFLLEKPASKLIMKIGAGQKADTRSGSNKKHNNKTSR